MDFEYYFRVGLRNIEDEKYKDAVRYLSVAIRLSPGHSEAICTRGNAYFQWKKYKKAISDYKRSIQTNESPNEPYFMLGLCYFRLKDFSTSLKYFLSAIEICSNFYAAILGVGDCLYIMKEYRESLQYYNKAILIHSHFDQAFRKRANCHEKLGNLFQAKEDVRTAKRIKRNLSRIRCNKSAPSGATRTRRPQRKLPKIRMNKTRNGPKISEDSRLLLSREEDKKRISTFEMNHYMCRFFQRKTKRDEQLDQKIDQLRSKLRFQQPLPNSSTNNENSKHSFVTKNLNLKRHKLPYLRQKKSRSKATIMAPIRRFNMKNFETNVKISDKNNFKNVLETNKKLNKLVKMNKKILSKNEKEETKWERIMVKNNTRYVFSHKRFGKMYGGWIR